jgi:predicted Zn-dependent protease
MMSEPGVPLDRLKERLEREPCIGAIQLLAETYYQQGQHPQAAETSRRGLELYPDNPDLRLILGQSLFALDQLIEVEEVLQPLVTEIGRLGEVFATLQQLYALQGREQEAIRARRLYQLLRGEDLGTAPPAEEGEHRRIRRRTLETLQKWQQVLNSWQTKG